MQQCMFDWDNVRIVLAVYRLGSLSAAAKHLRIHQATVGRRLTEFEEALGSRLFDRSSNGYRLTQVGKRQLLRFENIEAEALAIERDATGHESRLSGPVRITAPVAFASHFLTPRIGNFRKQHPDVCLEMLADNRTFNLSKREAEVALRLARPSQSSLLTRKLGTIAAAIYASKDYLNRKGMPRGEDFTGHDLIGFDESFQPEDDFSWLESHSDGAHVAFRSSNRLVQVAAANAGLGLALLHCYLARQLPNLVMVLPPHKVPARTLWLILHRDLRSSAKVRAVSDFLVHLVKRESKFLAGG